MQRIQSICISLANFLGEKLPIRNFPEGQCTPLNLRNGPKCTVEHEEYVADQGKNPSPSRNAPVQSGETENLRSNADQDSADDNDIVPDFDDTRPQNLLDRLISEYEAQVEIDVTREEYNDAIANQRRAIDCVIERNQAHGKKYELSEFKNSLGALLDRRGKPSDLREADEIDQQVFRGEQELVIDRPLKSQEILKPELGLAHCKGFYRMASRKYKKYRDSKQFKDLQASTKLANRSFKLALELGGEAQEVFLHSVQLLIDRQCFLVPSYTKFTD